MENRFLLTLETKSLEKLSLLISIFFAESGITVEVKFRGKLTHVDRAHALWVFGLQKIGFCQWTNFYLGKFRSWTPIS